MTPDGAARLEAAREKYATALRELNSLRCAKTTCVNHPNYAARVADARRRADEAQAEWAMMFEQETGRKLQIAS